MRATVQIRIDEDTRAQASQLFERIGLDIPTAVRMFLKQSIASNGLPFQPTIAKDNGLVTSRKQAGESLKQAFRLAQEQSVINGTDKMTMEEIDAEIAACRREKRGQS
jgi:DNA-damage-inducible protein J